jgi:hypothetical protein
MKSVNKQSSFFSKIKIFSTIKLNHFAYDIFPINLIYILIEIQQWPKNKDKKRNSSQYQVVRN